MSLVADSAVNGVLEFLACRTPRQWFAQAPLHLPELLIDHANCEKKAAGNALSLLYRYVDKSELLWELSRLAREELRHFEQVCEHMAVVGVAYRHLSSSRYVAGLRTQIRTHEPERLIDTLLVGAIVEARSCERFLGLIDVLPDGLSQFYQRLLASEARHFNLYLTLAQRYASVSFDAKLKALLEVDAALICEPDTDFRFHSGPLAGNTRAEAPSLVAF